MKLKCTQGSGDGLYLELVRLQFAFSCFGGQSWDIRADGWESFGVGIKHDRRNEAIGCTNGYAHVDHMVPGENSQSWRQHRNVGNTAF